MNNWITTPAYLGALRADETLALSASAARMPASLANWLARLRLLYGVPFNHLVPDSRLLPMESVRFFYIDRNFTDRLVDGALSVGKTTTREYAQAQATHTPVRARVDDEERVLRAQLRQEVKATRIVSPELTGLLMRSRAVSGWPGLEVKAYRGTTEGRPGGTPLPLLRMDRLAPDVLLCIFEGVPSRVDVEEPREGIQFGVDLKDRDGNGIVEPDADTPSGFRLKLRKVKGALAGQRALDLAQLEPETTGRVGIGFDDAVAVAVLEVDPELDAFARLLHVHARGHAFEDAQQHVGGEAVHAQQRQRRAAGPAFGGAPVGLDLQPRPARDRARTHEQAGEFGRDDAGGLHLLAQLRAQHALFVVHPRAHRCVRGLGLRVFAGGGLAHAERAIDEAVGEVAVDVEEAHRLHGQQAAVGHQVVEGHTVEQAQPRQPVGQRRGHAGGAGAQRQGLVGAQGAQVGRGGDPVVHGGASAVRTACGSPSAGC